MFSLELQNFRDMKTNKGPMKIFIVKNKMQQILHQWFSVFACRSSLKSKIFRCSDGFFCYQRLNKKINEDIFFFRQLYAQSFSISLILSWMADVEGFDMWMCIEK